MHKSVKMVKVNFPVVYESDIKHCEFAMDLYTKNSKLLTADNYYSFPIPSSTSWDDWSELRNNGEEFKEFVDKNPAYAPFELTIEADKYFDYDFALDGIGSIKLSITSRFVVDVNYDFSLSHINDYIVESQTSMVGMMKRQVETMNQIGKAMMDSEQHFNKRCDTPVSDTFLHKVNQTTILYDSCTDVLQQHLHDGWRILSITPQPNQRRPDYVLGMVVDPKDVDTSAYRG